MCLDVFDHTDMQWAPLPPSVVSILFSVLSHIPLTGDNTLEEQTFIFLNTYSIKNMATEQLVDQGMYPFEQK